MAEIILNDYSAQLSSALAADGTVISVTPGAPAAAVGNRIRARIGTEIVLAEVTTETSWTVVSREAEDATRFPKRAWGVGTAVDAVLTADGLSAVIEQEAPIPENIAFTDQPNEFTIGQVIYCASALDKGFVINLASGQTANAIEVRDSLGTLRTSTTAAGSLEFRNSAGTLTGKITNDLAGQGGVALESQGRIDLRANGIIYLGCTDSGDHRIEGQDGFGAVAWKMYTDWRTSTVRFLAGTYATGVPGETFSTGTYSAIKCGAPYPTVVGLTVQGAPSQSANLTEWKNQAGSAVAYLDNAGGAVLSGLYVTNPGASIAAAPSGTVALNIATGGTGNTGIVVNLASGQTASAIEVRDSLNAVALGIKCTVGGVTFITPYETTFDFTGGGGNSHVVMRDLTVTTPLKIGGYETQIGSAYGGLTSLINYSSGSSGGGTLSSIPQTVAQITSDQNDFALVRGCRFYRLSSDASRTITGLSMTVADGLEFELWNVGSNDIVLAHENASSTDVNRFACTTGANITLAPNEIACLRYDDTTDRFRVKV